MMVDWVSAKIPFSHGRPINGGRLISYNKNGEIEFITDKHFPIEGSYSSKIAIKTIQLDPYGEIHFSGNPNKFLQGHNLFGSTDVIGLMAATMEKVFAALNLTPSEQNLADIRAGNYALTRLDITAMYELPTRNDVLAWIRAAAHASRSRHKSGGILKGDTLYWGKTSRRWALKTYAKGQEIHAKGHELPLSAKLDQT